MQKKKHHKSLLAFIISVSVAAAVLAAILITDIFIPIKYLSVYVGISTDKPQSGELRISFIDVGNGDSTLVEFPDGKVALIDGGNGSKNNQLKIFKKLNGSEINKIDYLICTSPDAARCGGLAEIVKYKTADKIYAPICNNAEATQAYRDFRLKVKNKNQYINQLSYGTIAANEEYGYCFLILNSKKGLPDGEGVRSSAMWISYGGINLLMLGDLTASELLYLTEEYSTVGFEIDGHSINLNQCNIVKVARGGKESGKCAQFYDLIQAETAIISTGSFPEISVMSDITNFVGDNIYRTDINGTLTLSISNGNYTVKKER